MRFGTWLRFAFAMGLAVPIARCGTALPIPSLNTPGCMDLVLGQQSREKVAAGSGSCGDLINAATGCQDYACRTCSTIGTPGQTDFDNCAKSATANECKSYVAPINSITGPCAVLDGDAAPPAASNCFPSSASDIPNFLNVFCGTASD